MTQNAASGPAVQKILAATDRSPTAEEAVNWAANLATANRSELILFQALSRPDGPAQVAAAQASLEDLAQRVAGARGRARVVVDDDPAHAILHAIDAEDVDVVVIGNVGMSGRKQLLLANIPNQISHNARCSVVIVNTAQRAGHDGPTGHMRRHELAEQSTVEGRLLRRARRIGMTLAKAALATRRDAASASEEERLRAGARRLRVALDELGPTFAKLGQILSTRPDLLPAIFIDELATLQDRVTPLTEAEVVAVLERELGVPWDDVFASIDPRPLAAGTIAQVHRATLESGERVVIKVQRPQAEQDILQDLALLELFVQKAGSRPAFRRAIDLPAVVEHLAASLRRELDFRNEAANLKRMAEVLAPFPHLAVPASFDAYSTARVLVMEEVQGVPVREAPPSPARTEAARQLLEAYYHQVMVEGFFHADPHPGNMKWWNDKIYFLDLGMVGQVDADVRQHMLMLMLAFAQQDGSFLSEIVFALAGNEQPDVERDLDAFRADLQALVERYRKLSLKEIQLGPLLQEITRISVRHRVRVPAALTLMGKAFAQMQLVAAEMDPTLDPFAVAQSFVLRSTLRRMGGVLDPKQVFYEVEKARMRLTRVLAGIEGALGARAEGSLNVRFGGTEMLEASIDQASRRLAFAFGMCGTLALAAFTSGRPNVPRWLPALTGVIGTAMAAGLLRDRRRQ